jgi:hypothetical protein
MDCGSRFSAPEDDLFREFDWSANVRLSPVSRNTLLAPSFGLVQLALSVFPQFRKSGRLRLTSLPRSS